MNARWYISTDPASDPITAAEMEGALKLSSGFDSTTINRLLPAVTRKVEEDLNRSLIQRTITLKLDSWPSQEVIYLPKPPFVSVTSVSYLDTNGDSQPLVENTDYEVKLSGDSGRIVLAPNTSWPSVQSDKKEPITIVYVAGYGSSSSDVPDDIREACVRAGVMIYTNGEVGDVIYKGLIKKRRFYFDNRKND